MGEESSFWGIVVRGICEFVSFAVEEVHYASHRIRYPIRTDLEGYILQDNVPFIKQNDHLTKRKSNGFVVAGRNESRVIEGLESLVGFSIEELERRMYPDHRSQVSLSQYFGSNPNFGGFLKEGQRLIPRLVADNDFVLSQGLTHQDVAKPLLYISNLMRRTERFNLKFIYDGRKFKTSGNFWPMGQMSPFSNNFVVHAGDLTVTCVEDGSTLKFSTVHPYLIHGFGFYEGDVRYRIEPQKVIDFFGITAANDRTPLS